MGGNEQTPGAVEGKGAVAPRLAASALLVLILCAAAWLRFSGLGWGEDQYLHPDERFLLWVGSDIAPVSTVSGYFDTANSTLNPHNRGHGFFVYGTLPLFAARYIVQWVYGHSGFAEMEVVGRSLSSLADLLAVLLVFALGARYFGRSVGLLGSAFYAFAVLPIQLSHYFKEDTFASFFVLLALYLAMAASEAECAPAGQAWSVAKERLFFISLGFGLVVGCAAACKVTAASAALVLPAALAVHLLRAPCERRRERLTRTLACLAAAALVACVVFRVLQPYAFSGPGFFNWRLNPRWVANMLELRGQVSGLVDMPPSLQWARRPVWFALQNLVQWGLGAPLGLVACAGLLWALYRTLTKGWCNASLPSIWTVAYLGWQSLSFNPTMRYQLVVYPALCVLAAWCLVRLFGLRRREAAAIGSLVLLATALWAVAFTRIYARPITRVAASRWIYQNVAGPITLSIRGAGGVHHLPLPVPDAKPVSSGHPYVANFTPKVDGELYEIYLPRVVPLPGKPGKTGPWSVAASVQPRDAGTGSAAAAGKAALKSDPRPGDLSCRILLDRPVAVSSGRQYQVTLAFEGGGTAMQLLGSALAQESSWDDSLPLRVDGYDGYGGIYSGELNLEMYWDDNEDKRSRILTILNQADFILISSNRQWATTTRVPERYPLTTAYYRHLLGCPPDREVIWCYATAQVGAFEGDLGFRLARVFDSPPSIGRFRVNDQFAEEAFTVYDHPKVFVYQKTPSFDIEKVKAILGGVDLTQVIRVAPRLAGSHPASLMLTPERWAQQQAGGTWGELFPAHYWQNRSQLIAVLLWYLALTVIGMGVYPLLRRALPGLADGGYPLARTAGILALAYLVWLAGSFHIAFNRLTVSLAALILLLAGALAAYRDRSALRAQWRDEKRRFLAAEALFLAFFVFDLLLRIVNPDLWHPWRGGEKPMDLSFLTAVVKSSSFPPYDPWFAGGYLNYYYFGFVLFAVPVKWLGIAPSLAFNLVLPTIFALMAAGACSIGWNLATRRKLRAGIIAAVSMTVVGNLGVVQMFLEGLRRIGAPEGDGSQGGVVAQALWMLKGSGRLLKGATLPFSTADWYWAPSRMIPAPHEVAPITEFPFFSVLQGDLHPHLFALPLALFVLACVLSLILAGSPRRVGTGLVPTLVAAALGVGALYATNAWDFYPYLGLCILALCVTVSLRRRFLVLAAAVAFLTVLAVLLFAPFRNWYSPGYGELELWKGTRTPLRSYLAHWGLFLFLIASWLVCETRDWMASTPLSALRKLEPYKDLIKLALFLFAVFVLGVSLAGVKIAWLVLILAAWAGVLLWRPGLSNARRFLLLGAGAGLLLTLVVEVIVLRGDVARMNTVFKAYMQAWTLLSLSAAGAFIFLLDRPAVWRRRWRAGWAAALAVLVISAGLYPVVASRAKIKDRMTPGAPHGIDGAAFLDTAKYTEDWGEMDLSQDYRAIRWLREQAQGSPVIVEANHRKLYRWGSRFTVHTGLPGVVGWEWHVRQQHSLLPDTWITRRTAEVDEFYQTTSLDVAEAFLRRYDVGYIILGQQERGLYGEGGLEKFDAAASILWKEVYRDRDTRILKVALQEPVAPGGSRR